MLLGALKRPLFRLSPRASYRSRSRKHMDPTPTQQPSPTTTVARLEKPPTAPLTPPLVAPRSSLGNTQATSPKPEAELKKSKTGVSSTKKRKHLAIDREGDFGLDAEYGGAKPEPANWREVHALIEEARESMTAPVDVVGAESLGHWKAVENGTMEPKNARFRTLLSLMLSSQTKDQVTADAMANLSKRFPPLSVASMLNATEADIDSCISKVGFHNRKAIYIKNAVQVLNERYDGDIPETLAEIMDLQGVGPKMAFLLMQIAWKKVIGIGVDTHVHRISNRLGWVRSKNPEETRAQLEKWLPKEYWGTINKTLVGFGQMVCLPVRPKCEECPVSSLCPSSTVSRVTKKP